MHGKFKNEEKLRNYVKFFITAKSRSLRRWKTMRRKLLDDFLRSWIVVLEGRSDLLDFRSFLCHFQCRRSEFWVIMMQKRERKECFRYVEVRLMILEKIRVFLCFFSVFYREFLNNHDEKSENSNNYHYSKWHYTRLYIF